MDDNNQQSATSNQPSDQNVIAPSGGSGTHKETGPLPSASADFSELHVSDVPTEPEPSAETNNAKSSNQGMQQELTKEEARIVAEAKDAGKAAPVLAATGKQLPLTQQQAQQILKGPLFLKKSSNPMLWLAFLMLRHYQWLVKQKREKKE